MCEQVQGRIKNGFQFPKLGGHIAFKASDYTGPFYNVVQQNCQNVPLPSVFSDVPAVFDIVSKITCNTHNLDLKQEIAACYTSKDIANTTNIPTVQKFQKLTQGLVKVPFDKNAGMLCICCPVIYERMMHTTLDLNNLDNYKHITPRKFDNNKADKYATKNTGF